jgi:hypothetical protein
MERPPAGKGAVGPATAPSATAAIAAPSGPVGTTTVGTHVLVVTSQVVPPPQAHTLARPPGEVPSPQAAQAVPFQKVLAAQPEGLERRR